MNNKINVGLASLILRVVTGGYFAKEGIAKVQNLEGVAGWFGSLGVPSFLAYFVTFGELIGGIALILGLYTRLAAVLGIPIMLGATYFLANGTIMGPWQYPFLVATVFLALFLQGGGSFALKGFTVFDRIIPKIFQD
jgi:putative oxidoreductase